MYDIVVNHWPAEFRALYGGEWPRNYVCFDLETTGCDFKRDLITEIGHVLVRDGEVVDRLSIVLDWTNHPGVQLAWLERTLAHLKYHMESADKPCHITPELMREKGMDPLKALSFYYKLFTALADQQTMFVAHNGIAFDTRMLEANLNTFLEPATPIMLFTPNGLLDTHCIEKASQDLANPRMVPKPGDTLRSYFHKVHYARVTGVKSTLYPHCYHKYGFEKHGVDLAKAHSAEADAFCLHILMEAWRCQIRPTATISTVELTPRSDATSSSRTATVVAWNFGAKPSPTSRVRQRNR